MAVVTPDLPELFEEAYERAGLSMQDAYRVRSKDGPKKLEPIDS